MGIWHGFFILKQDVDQVEMFRGGFSLWIEVLDQLTC